MTGKPAGRNFFLLLNRFLAQGKRKIMEDMVSSKAKGGVATNSRTNSHISSKVVGAISRHSVNQAKVGGQIKATGITRARTKDGETSLKTAVGASLHQITKDGANSHSRITADGETSSQLTKKTGAAAVDGDHDTYCFLYFCYTTLLNWIEKVYLLLC